MVVIKFQLGNDVRRITLPEEGTTYAALLQLIERLYGSTLPLEFKLKYLDEDRDLIALTSDEELQAATAHLPTGKILRLTIVDAAAPPAPSSPGVGAQTDADNDVPHDAFCRHCGRPVQGVRFLCVNCYDSADDGGYSLCAACEALRPHDPQHVFLKLYSAPPPGALASILPLPNLYAPAAAVGPLDDQACPNWLRQRQPLSTVARASSSASVSKLACRFVEDVTVSDGYRVAPGAPFVKIWRLRNTSRTTAWPEGLALAFVSGDRLAAVEAVPVLAAPPGAEVDVTVDMVSPPEVGRYVSNWRLCSPSGDFFGPQVWADIVVAEEEEEEVAAPAITGTEEDVIPVMVEKKEEEVEDKQEKEEKKEDEEEEESDMEDAWAVGSGTKVRRVAGKVLGRSSSSIETAFSTGGNDEANDEPNVIEIAESQQPPFAFEEEQDHQQQAEEQVDVNLRGSARRLIREEEEEDGWALVPRNELVNAVAVGPAVEDEAKEGEEEVWADEIKRLLELGVGDRAAIVRALRSTSGDAQQAVEALLGGL